MSGTIDGPASSALMPLIHYAWYPSVGLPASSARRLGYGIQDVNVRLKKPGNPHGNMWQVLIPHHITVMGDGHIGNGLDIPATVIRRQINPNGPMVSVPPISKWGQSKIKLGF